MNKLKYLKFSITYSLFVNCLLECVHFLVFKIVSVVRHILGITEVTYTPDINLLTFRISVLIPYILVILLIYFCKRTSNGTIKKFSNYRIFPIFLYLILILIIYLKYHIKYINSDMFHNILTVVLLAIIVLSLVFFVSSKIFINIIYNFTNRKINPAIEDSKLQKSI